MHTLRHARYLARLMVAWFVLSLGVAVASPLVAPLDMELVCSSTGAMKVLVKSADGSTASQTGHTLDCPLCAALGAPPPVHTVVFPRCCRWAMCCRASRPRASRPSRRHPCRRAVRPHSPELNFPATACARLS